MAWTTPQYTREQVNEAARTLLNPPRSPIRRIEEGQLELAGPEEKLKIDEWIDKIEGTFRIINNWRGVTIHRRCWS